MPDTQPRFNYALLSHSYQYKQLWKSILNKFYRNMPAARTNSFKTRPNVVVVPIRLEPLEPLLSQPPSPRHSRVKLHIVSPSNKARHSVKENQAPPHSKAILLGGKAVRTNSIHQRNDSSQQRCSHPVFPTNERSVFLANSPLPTLFQSFANSTQPILRQQPTHVRIVRSPSQGIRAPSPSQVLRNSSPSQRIYINNKLVQPFLRRDSDPVGTQTANQKLPLRQSEGQSGEQMDSELAIQEQSSMENLKESYESEIKEIRKLQDEIHTNNVEIKQLLRASQASHSQEDEAEEQMSILEEQSFLPQKSSPPQQSSLPPRNHSKKTIINELRIDSLNRIERVESSASQPERSNDQASVQTDKLLPEHEDRDEVKMVRSRAERLSLSSNAECQVQLIPTGEPQLVGWPLEEAVERPNSRDSSSFTKSRRSEVYLDQPFNEKKGLGRIEDIVSKGRVFEKSSNQRRSREERHEREPDNRISEIDLCSSQLKREEVECEVEQDSYNGQLESSWQGQQSAWQGQMIRSSRSVLTTQTAMGKVAAVWQGQGPRQPFSVKKKAKISNRMYL